MKRNYQSGAQKRQAKRRKIVEAATNFQRLSAWLTRPETSKADEQDVSIRGTESTPQLVDDNSFNNSTNEENSDTTKDRSDARKNDNFPTIIVNSEIKKAIIAADPKQPEGPFPKDPLQSGLLFSTNYYHYVTQSGIKLEDIGYVIHQAWTVFTASPASYFCIKMSLQGLLTHFKTFGVQQV